MKVTIILLLFYSLSAVLLIPLHPVSLVIACSHSDNSGSSILITCNAPCFDFDEPVTSKALESSVPTTRISTSTFTASNGALSLGLSHSANTNCKASGWTWFPRRWPGFLRSGAPRPGAPGPWESRAHARPLGVGPRRRPGPGPRHSRRPAVASAVPRSSPRSCHSLSFPLILLPTLRANPGSGWPPFVRLARRAPARTALTLTALRHAGRLRPESLQARVRGKRGRRGSESAAGSGSRCRRALGAGHIPALERPLISEAALWGLSSLLLLLPAGTPPL